MCAIQLAHAADRSINRPVPKVLWSVMMLIIIDGAFEQLWNDYQLNWEPTEFGGINVIRILPEKVWKPDIVLFNKSVTSSLPTDWAHSMGP